VHGLIFCIQIWELLTICKKVVTMLGIP
jgi:hypothetical protein